MSLPPWAEGPFELILHGELHYRVREDFDRRMALISFDNAIEVAITTYLSLHPIQRKNREYEKAQVIEWSRNFHTKLEFWEIECSARGIQLRYDRAILVWYHGLRNKHYHEGSPSSPNWSDLQGLREAAMWVFSVLYEIPDVEQILDDRIRELSETQIEDIPTDVLPRDPSLDDAIDSVYGIIEFADNVFLASDILHSLDPRAYREVALEILASDRPQLRAVS